ncbi:MAG: hypothetical protein P1V97_04040 [Planctomycetota bacterium]|nr:hypothetical protein [Planctomycetota bacterium]
MNNGPHLGEPCYDLSHLDDVKFGAERQIDTIFPPDHVFFGLLAALLLPGGGLLIPVAFLCANFLKLKRPKMAAVSMTSALLICGLGYIYPEPTLRKVMTIVLGFALMLYQARLIRHANIVGTVEVSEHSKVGRMMLLYFFLALLSFSSCWTWLINTQLNHAISKIENAESLEERGQGLRYLLHFDEEIRDLFGRSVALTLREQEAALSVSDLETSKKVCQHWKEFNDHVSEKVEAALKKSDAATESYQGLERPLKLDEFLDSLSPAPERVSSDE